MPEILNPVAKISASIAESLYAEDNQWDIIGDANCKIIIDAEDAAESLDVSDYTLIDFTPIFIGSPRPKRKPKS